MPQSREIDLGQPERCASSSRRPRRRRARAARRARRRPGRPRPCSPPPGGGPRGTPGRAAARPSRAGVGSRSTPASSWPRSVRLTICDADLLEALHHALACLVLGLVVAAQVDVLGRHPAGADHPGRAVGRRLDVAADAGRVLAVEDALGRHRAERPDRAARSPRCATTRTAPPSAAPCDGRASRRGGGSRAVSTPRPSGTRAPRRRGPASWIATARVSSGTYSMLIAVPDSTVVIASTRSSQPNASRPEWWAIVERHRADLLDHRRRVAHRHAGELVAPAAAVELGDVETRSR